MEYPGLLFHSICLNEFLKMMNQDFPIKDDWEIPYEKDPDFRPEI